MTIKLGLIASLNRPGGNATGMSLFRKELVSKQLELLHDLVPKAEVVAVLVNPANRQSDGYVLDIREAILVLQRQLRTLSASTEAEIDASFPSIIEQGAGALIITADTLFNNQRDQLAALATRYLLPTVSQFREFAAAGGLMSYGPDVADVYRQVGIYTGRILNGSRPADLPVMQPTKFDLVINLKTAKALGLTVPPSLLVRADEVIE
jgi:putative tryptophan/tyrosine transport system substrate-binding protein